MFLNRASVVMALIQRKGSVKFGTHQIRLEAKPDEERLGMVESGEVTSEIVDHEVRVIVGLNAL